MKKQHQGQQSHQNHYHQANPQQNFNNNASNGMAPVGYYQNPHSPNHINHQQQQQQQQQFYYSNTLPAKNQPQQQSINVQRQLSNNQNRHNSHNGYHNNSNNTQSIHEVNHHHHHHQQQQLQQQQHYQHLNGQSNRFNNSNNNYPNISNNGKPERRSSYSSSNSNTNSNIINSQSQQQQQQQQQWFYVNNNSQALSKSHQNLVNLNQSDLNLVKSLVIEKKNFSRNISTGNSLYNADDTNSNTISNSDTGSSKADLSEQVKNMSLSSLKENSPSNTELEQQQQLQSITTTPATTELKLHLLTTTTATRNSIVVKSSTSLSPVYEKEKSSLITDMTNSSSEMDLKSEDSSCLSPDKKSYSSSESLDVFRSQPTLSDIINPESKYDTKSEFYKDFVIAIDRLYPDYKWPLHDTWTFSYIKHDNSIKNWSDRIMTFMDVSYIEDFWSGVNYLFNAGLTAGGDLTFFKKGIKPEWEDTQNRSGGCWLYQMSHQNQNKKIEDLWLETLMGLIGDNFCEPGLIKKLDSKYDESETEHVCEIISGTILMHRGKNEKISLWTKDYKDDHSTRLIGKIWKNLLGLNDTVIINFEAHETKNNKNTSVRIAYKE